MKKDVAEFGGQEYSKPLTCVINATIGYSEIETGYHFYGFCAEFAEDFLGQ